MPVSVSVPVFVWAVTRTPGLRLKRIISFALGAISACSPRHVNKSLFSSEMARGSALHSSRLFCLFPLMFDNVSLRGISIFQMSWILPVGCVYTYNLFSIDASPRIRGLFGIPSPRAYNVGGGQHSAQHVKKSFKSLHGFKHVYINFSLVWKIFFLERKDRKALEGRKPNIFAKRRERKEEYKTWGAKAPDCVCACTRVTEP